jgi:hypothetical protein
MLEENRTRVLQATEDLAKQIAELKALVSQMQGHDTRGAFTKFRAHVLRTKPRAARVPSRRKLPRR